MTAGTCDLVETFRAAADDWDRAGRLPDGVVRAVAQRGWLGAVIPAEHAGLGLDRLAFGRLCADLGGVCTSLRSLLTVQSLVAEVIRRRGTADQRREWLPALADGTVIAAIAVTEHAAGSDPAAVQTRIEPVGGTVRVTGHKRWVTFGDRAGVYLVLGRAPQGPTAVLVPRDAAGVDVTPVRGQLGLRAAGIAHVTLDGTPVPSHHVLGGAGAGASQVVAAALDHGRYSVAWGCVGMADACLDLSAAHAVAERDAGPLAQHQLVRRLVTDMVAAVTSARLVCEDAAHGVQPGATMLAKYVAARAAAAVTRDAVQVLGASGCEPGHPAERFFRDAKLMQIIEGTDEVCQTHICDTEFRRHTARARRGVA